MEKKIKKVRIIPGCISCGTCEAICPKVFEVKDIAYVKDDAEIAGNEEEIREAVDMCPVSVIEIDEEE